MACCGCLPWHSSSSQQPKPAPKDTSGVPSTAEYALEGVKVSLDLLKVAADFVPFPYVRPALDAAITLITIGEDVQSSIKRVDDLNKRVWSLMLVMIEPLKGKKPQDIPPELKSDIEHLTSDLLGMENTLRRISAQNRLVLILFKKLNEGKVEDCLTQLDESLSKFHVSREINNAILVWEMATGIKAAYGLAEESLKVTQQGLEVAKAGLDVTNNTLGIAQETRELTKENIGIANQGLLIAHDGLGVAKEGLKVTTRMADQVDDLHNALKQRIHGASTLPSREMPTKPRIFYGRDEVVNNVAHLLTADEHPHVALLGPGGMGKTSIGLAVMAHPSIMAKFGDRRFWVPCVEGRSPTRFLDILVSCLRITQDTGDLLSDILFELKASSDPRVILLDNFETPWNLDDHRDEIEHIICALAEVPHIALLVTMRSNYPPSEEIEWHSQPVAFLDVPEARRVYTTIHPAASSDSTLETLLAELGHMPLAITLMAKLGKKSGDMPATLLKTWREENIRTDMLDGGSDSKRSINVSIALSVYSAPMKAKPDAFTLLATLSMFPAGTQRKHLERWAPAVSGMSSALATLTDTSLADQRAGSIYILPVIRSYVSHPVRFPEAVKKYVRQAIYQFMADHKSTPGDANFVQDAQELANEETNVQTILLDAISDGFNTLAVDALLTYCWYQHWTRPRLDIIETVLHHSRDAKQDTYIAESLYALGHIYHKLDRYDDARIALTEAREVFKGVENRLKAAQCLLKLSEIYMYMQDSMACRNAITEAQTELRNIGDANGIADGLLHLGEYYWFTRSNVKCREVLQTAQQDYVKLGKPLGAVHCTFWISRSYHSDLMYPQARNAAEEALADYKRLDYRDRITECLIHLCRILKETECYDEALAGILEGLEKSQITGRPIAIAQYLQELGEVYMKTEKYDQACAAFEESVEMHKHVGSFMGKIGTARCLECLGDIYILQSRRSEATVVLKKACEEFRTIGSNMMYRCTQKLVKIEAELKGTEKPSEGLDRGFDV